MEKQPSTIMLCNADHHLEKHSLNFVFYFLFCLLWGSQQQQQQQQKKMCAPCVKEKPRLFDDKTIKSRKRRPSSNKMNEMKLKQQLGVVVVVVILEMNAKQATNNLQNTVKKLLMEIRKRETSFGVISFGVRRRRVFVSVEMRSQRPIGMYSRVFFFLSFYRQENCRLV